jgi:hypothetical protein
MKNLPANISNALLAMGAVAAKIDNAIGDFSYLKLAKDGTWVHGSEDTEIDYNSMFAVSLESFFAGYQAWDEGELLGEETDLITEPAIVKAQLPDVGAPWKPLLGVQLMCVDGEDKGLKLLYKTTSVGGIKEVTNFMKAIDAHVQSGKHNNKFVPVVVLATDSYKHKKYGKIYTPILEIVEWLEDLPADLKQGGEPKAEAAEEVAKQEVVEEVVEEEQPRRRRRRA